MSAEDAAQVQVPRSQDRYLPNRRIIVTREDDTILEQLGRWIWGKIRGRDDIP